MATLGAVESQLGNIAAALGDCVLIRACVRPFIFDGIDDAEADHIMVVTWVRMLTGMKKGIAGITGRGIVPARVVIMMVMKMVMGGVVLVMVTTMLLKTMKMVKPEKDRVNCAVDSAGADVNM